jgi:hypothetical protein
LFGGLTNRGTVTAAKAPQGLSIHGNFEQASSGKLTVNIDGAISTNNYSSLKVDGGVMLRGTLDIQRSGGFVPDTVSDYVILSAASVSGQFNTITGGDTNPDPDLTPTYGSSVVVLSRGFDRMELMGFSYINSLPGQRTFFDSKQDSQGRIEYRVFDPNDALVFVSNALPTGVDQGDGGPFTLDKTGIYKIRTYAQPGDNPSYDWQIASAPRKAGSLQLNVPLSDSISVPGETHSWSFDVPAPTQVALDVQAIIPSSQRLSFSLMAPDGRTIANTSADSSTLDKADFGLMDLKASGTYRLIVDGIGDDVATYQLLLHGPDSPRIVSYALKGPTPNTINAAWFRFSQSMDRSAGNFDAAQDVLNFVNSNGSISIESAVWQDSQTLVLNFAPIAAGESLFIVLSPHILSASGVPLDQDGDLVPGEPLDDQYSTEMTLDNTGPRVFLADPQGSASVPVDHVTFHFSEPIDPASVALADITSFTGPGGVNLQNQLTQVLVTGRDLTVFFVAQVASGQFSLTVGPHITDAAGNEMDQNQDGSNGQTADGYTWTAELRSADLGVITVGNPVNTTFPDPLNLSWTVRNDGHDPAKGVWWDYVYLSSDATWDLADTLVAKIPYDSSARGQVAANGGTYQGTVTARMPGVVPGDYYVIVRTNLLHSVPESNLANDVATSANKAHFELPTLVSRTPQSGDVNYRDGVYAKLVITPQQAGQSVLFRFGTSNTSVANDLYVRHGALPTRSSFDLRSQQGLQSNQYLILPNAKPGTYYVLGLAAPDDQKQVGILGQYTLEADILGSGEFTVAETYFGQGGTAGRRTIEINGANFDRSITAKLTSGANVTLDAISYYRVGPEKLYATFDLTSVTPGKFNVVLKNSAGQVETIGSSLDVIDNRSSSDGLEPHVTAPPAFRRPFHSPFAHFPTQVTWSNNGLNDAAIPVVIFTSTEPFAEDFEANVTGSGWNQTFSGVNSAMFFALDGSGTGIPGVLLPGQQGGRTYEVVPRLARVANEAAVFSLDVLFDDPDQPFNWSSERDRLSGLNLSKAEFQDIFSQFSTAVGPNQRDYVGMLATTAQLFRSLPTDVFEATRLLTQEAFTRFATTKTASIIGQIDYKTFDIDFSQLEVVVTNQATLETFTAPVRLDGKFALPNVGAGTFDIAVRGGAVAVGAPPIVVTEGAARDVTVQVLLGGAIRGSVLSPTGSPVAGASLVVSSQSLDQSRVIDLATDGSFEIADLPPGDYILTATANGRVAATTNVTVEIGGVYSKSLALEVGTVLSGTVKGPSNTLVSGALVRLTNPLTGAVVSTVTGDDGRYTYDGVPAGTWEALVSHSQYQDLARTISVSGAAKSESFTLAAGAVVTGRVVSSTTTPVAGAVVGVVTNGALRTVVTGADGLFIVAGLTPGDAQLEVDTVGFARILQVIGAISTDAPTNLGDITLSKGLSFLGQITDSAGVPIADAVVILESNSGLLLTNVTTGADGFASFSTLSPGVYRISVAAEGYASRTELIELTRDGQQVIQLAVEATLKGTVIGATDGIVALYQSEQLVRWAVIEMDGKYSFDKLVAGAYVAKILRGPQHYESLLVTVNAGDRLQRNFVTVGGSPSGVALTVQEVQMSDPNCVAAGLPADCVAGAAAELENADQRYEEVSNKSGDVNDIPWHQLPDFGDANAPDCFCNSPDLKDAYQQLKELEQSLKAERQRIASLRATAEQTYNRLKARADDADYEFVHYADLAQQDIAFIIRIVDAYDGNLADDDTIETIRLIYETLQDDLRTANDGLSKLDSLLTDMAVVKIEFNAKVDAIRDEVVDYNEKVRVYEDLRRQEIDNCLPPLPPSGSATVPKFGGTSVDLLSPAGRAALAQFAANGSAWYVRVVDNPSGSGVTITPDGGAEVGDGDCGTFTITLQLVIECNDGDGHQLILQGTFTLTRTPIHIPITVNCGEEPPDDTDCFIYDVTYVGDCGSYDPNDITGPRGVGDEKWISESRSYSYTIGFENDAKKASAPAAVVRVTQALDADLDFSSFRLGTIIFGDVSLRDAVGLSSFETRLDYRNTLGIFLDVHAGIDVTTGEAFWELKSIDPATGEVPSNPLIGFLPPNVDGSEGQGYVSYSIRPKNALQTGAEIVAQATIYFDQNEPIDTPTIFNTIDAGTPSSAITALPATSYSGVSVQWSGEDDLGGSGIGTYNIYVSQDDGPFRPWLVQTELTEATFEGAQPGHKYGFYAVARDLVGHLQARPSKADTETTILDAPHVTQVNATARTISVVFSESMAVDELIASGEIASAVTIRNSTDDVVVLDNETFAYNSASHQLTISWLNSLPPSRYSLHLDALAFRNSAGGHLRAGWSGGSFRLNSFGSASPISNGDSEVIQGTASATPSLIDWNADGKVDVIVGEAINFNQSKVRLYLNQGTLTAPLFNSYGFAQGLDGDLIISSASIVPILQDWNGDGDRDLIVGLADGRVQIWTNIETNDSPVFAIPKYVQVGPIGSKADIDVGDRASISFVDWNSDGKSDLIVAGSDGRVHVFINSGTSTHPAFVDDLILNVGSNPLTIPGGASVAVADLNGDGRNDLLVGNSSGHLQFYPNIGSGVVPTFISGWVVQANGQSDLGFGLQYIQPSIGDLNADGKPDLIVGADDGSVKIILGQAGSIDLTVENSVSATHEFTRVFDLTSHVWHNQHRSVDVNDDNVIAADDVLTIINYINAHGSGPIPQSAIAKKPYLDTTGGSDGFGDDYIAADDVVAVINYINAHPGQSEGENTDSFYSTDFDQSAMMLDGAAGEASDEATASNDGVDLALLELTADDSSLGAPPEGENKPTILTSQRVISAFSNRPEWKQDLDSSKLHNLTGLNAEVKSADAVFGELNGRLSKSHRAAIAATWNKTTPGVTLNDSFKATRTK